VTVLRKVSRSEVVATNLQMAEIVLRHGMPSS
jgi:hypothetical protein